MEMFAQRETLASLMTEDPFCTREGVQTLESTGHHARLAQAENDLQLHLRRQELPLMLTSDLLIRNVPLREGVAPDIALWPRHMLDPEQNYRSLVLSEELCPALVLEVTSESTVEADREIKHEIYRLAGIAEYWLHDPMGCAGGPPLLGWRLIGNAYVPIAEQRGVVAGQEVQLYPSAVLDTAWGLDDTELRLRDPVRADWYRMTPEAFEQAETRAQQAETRVEQAEAQIQQERIRAQQQENLWQQEKQRLYALLGDRADRD